MSNMVLPVACMWYIAFQKPLWERHVCKGQVSCVLKLQKILGCLGVLPSPLCKLQPLSWQNN